MIQFYYEHSVGKILICINILKLGNFLTYSKVFETNYFLIESWSNINIFILVAETSMRWKAC